MGDRNEHLHSIFQDEDGIKPARRLKLDFKRVKAILEVEPFQDITPLKLNAIADEMRDVVDDLEHLLVFALDKKRPKKDFPK